MLFAELNGTVIHHQVISGPAGKLPILFANSLGTDFRIWRDVIVRLAGEHPLVTYDKRGHGLSGLGANPCSIDDHVGDMEALLAHLGIGEAIICGVSVGGLIALGLAAKRPDLVRGLVLCDTAHKLGTTDSWNARIAAVEAEGIEAIADGVMANWFSAGFRQRRTAELAGYRAMLTRTPVAGYVATCAAIRDADHTEAARHLGVPAICLVGDEDGSTPPALVKSLSKLIADSRYEIIKGAGHLPSIEQPEAVTALIRDCVQLAGEPGPAKTRH